MQEIFNYLPFSQPDVMRVVGLIKYIFLVYAVGLTIEYFFPAQKNQSADKIRFNLIYTLNFVIVNALLFSFLIKIKKPVVEFLGGPYLTLSFDATLVGQFLHVMTFMLVFDFFYYWFHRWQHVFPAFWAQHQLHHSEKALNVTTGNRHHWLENTFRIFIILIPMSILFNFKHETTGIIWTTIMLWGYFIHLNIKFYFGWLAPIIGGPQVHRIHHSDQKQHLDKNFAAFFPFYDVLFGTFYNPKKDEYPTTGLYKSDLEMNTFKMANFYPFMYWFGKIKNK